MYDKIFPVWKQGSGPFHFNSNHQIYYLQKFNSIKHHKKRLVKPVLNRIGVGEDNPALKRKYIQICWPFLLALTADVKEKVNYERSRDKHAH